MPSDWTSMNLTFTESASPITVTINIQNRSTDREIAVSLTDSTNISNVAVTRECDGTSINASDSRNIPGGETITYTFELNVQSQNSSANGAFNLTIGLETPGPQTYEYFTFEVNEDGKTVTLTDYDPSLSDSTDITIPATVDLVDGVWQDGSTYIVTALANGSYMTGTGWAGVFTNSEITSIDLPSTLQSIGSYAFYDCSGLIGELNLGECTSLTSIGFSAFWYCSGLTDISLPSSLKAIGSSAFCNCSGLTSISLPSSLKAIGSDAFAGCSKLTGELNLGECTSLTSIGGDAFERCRGLTSISLPSSLTDIGSNAFDSCSSLTEVIIDSEYVYTNATSTSACGDLFNNTSITTVKVLTSLVEAGENSYITTNFPSVTTEAIDGKNYTVYSNKAF